MPDPTLADATAKVDDYITTLMKGMHAAIREVTVGIFDNPETLLPLIDGAAYWPGSEGDQPLDGLDAYDVTTKLQGVVWASALPLVWSTGTENRQVFIA